MVSWSFESQFTSLRYRQFLAVAFLICAAFAQYAKANQDFIVLQSTTSTQSSGLYEFILPLFQDEAGIAVRVVAVGTGQALRNARNCDGDVLIVHAREAELAFVEAGFGGQRHDLMYNQFLIVGPGSDPADVQHAASASDAFRRIWESGSLFISRGDDSGTHKREIAIWKSADRSPLREWYRETGSGMGATLNIAVTLDGYVLTDNATWARFGNKVAHEPLFSEDTALVNQYGIITVSPKHCPHVKADLAGSFVEWMLSRDGQEAIQGYEINGKRLFKPGSAEGSS